jgi:hypothetical protein
MNVGIVILLQCDLYAVIFNVADAEWKRKMRWLGR